MESETPPPASTFSRAEANQLRGIAAKLYRARVADARAKYRADLAAIKTVCVACGPDRPIDHIRAAINAFDGEFTVPMLAEWINRNRPGAVLGRTTLGSRIHRMRGGSSPEVLMVRPGAGRHSGVYRKARA